MRRKMKMIRNEDESGRLEVNVSEVLIANEAIK